MFNFYIVFINLINSNFGENMSWLESLKNPSEIVELWSSSVKVDFASNSNDDVKLPIETIAFCCNVTASFLQNRTPSLRDFRIQNPVAYLPCTDDSFYDVHENSVTTLSTKNKTVQIWDCRKLSCPVETRLYEELWKVSYISASGIFC